MTPQEVSSALKAIGPNVEYGAKQSNSSLMHTWVVSEFPSPRQHKGKVALLCMLDEIGPVTEEHIEEGRRRYEASV